MIICKRAIGGVKTKHILLSFSLIILLTVQAVAGQDDGWFGVHSLNFSLSEDTSSSQVNLNVLHGNLAAEEKNISSCLPADDSTKNIVLANISILTPKSELFSIPLSHATNGKQYAFQSGWSSAFETDLSLDATLKTLKPYEAKIKSNSITEQEANSLIESFLKISANKNRFEQEILTQFYFLNDIVPIRQINFSQDA